MKKTIKNLFIILVVAMYFVFAYILLMPMLASYKQEQNSIENAQSFLANTKTTRAQFEAFLKNATDYVKKTIPEENILNTSEAQGEKTENTKILYQKYIETNYEKLPEDIKRELPYRDLYEKMAAYNKTIVDDKQTGLSIPFSYEEEVFNLREYGFDDDIIGSLYFPRMEKTFPVYLGASRSNLAKGIAQMSNTSMPIGGNNTNIVIAGHRGWDNGRFLKEIEDVTIGSVLELTTPWEIMYYEAKEIHVIQPNDIQAIMIQPGRELLTIVTCHPYGSGGTYRYILICERIEKPSHDISPNSEIEQTNTIARKDQSGQPTQKEVIEPISTQDNTVISSTPNTANSYTINNAENENTEIESSYKTILIDDILHYIAIGLLILFPIVILVLFIPHSKKKKK